MLDGARLPGLRRAFSARRCRGHSPPRLSLRVDGCQPCRTQTQSRDGHLRRTSPVPQNSDPRAKPHSAVEKSGESERTWKRPIAVVIPAGTTAKQMYCPAARCCCVHVMNRSNPSTVVGGGEMKRVTSSVVSIASSEGASLSSSSRIVKAPLDRTGSASRQSDCTDSVSSPGRSRRQRWADRNPFP